MPRIVVVGGNAAGMSAASRAKRLRPELDVVVFERNKHVSYGSCGIPYYISGVVKSINDLIHVPLEVFRKERGIDVRIKHEVVEVDVSGKSVTVINRVREEKSILNMISLY